MQCCAVPFPCCRHRTSQQVLAVDQCIDSSDKCMMRFLKARQHVCWADAERCCDISMLQALDRPASAAVDQCIDSIDDCMMGFLTAQQQVCWAHAVLCRALDSPAACVLGSCSAVPCPFPCCRHWTSQQVLAVDQCIDSSDDCMMGFLAAQQQVCWVDAVLCRAIPMLALDKPETAEVNQCIDTVTNALCAS